MIVPSCLCICLASVRFSTFLSTYLFVLLPVISADSALVTLAFKNSCWLYESEPEKGESELYTEVLV